MFPTTTVYVGKPDVDFWPDPANAERLNLSHRYLDRAVQTVKPYLDAGSLEMFSRETVILPGITALPTPRHTPGHSFYMVKSEDESIGFCSDIAHVGYPPSYETVRISTPSFVTATVGSN